MAAVVVVVVVVVVQCSCSDLLAESEELWDNEQGEEYF